MVLPPLPSRFHHNDPPAWRIDSLAWHLSCDFLSFVCCGPYGLITFFCMQCTVWWRNRYWKWSRNLRIQPKSGTIVQTRCGCAVTASFKQLLEKFGIMFSTNSLLSYVNAPWRLKYLRTFANDTTTRALALLKLTQLCFGNGWRIDSLAWHLSCNFLSFVCSGPCRLITFFWWRNCYSKYSLGSNHSPT